jgi:hypothetical protein
MITRKMRGAGGFGRSFWLRITSTPAMLSVPCAHTQSLQRRRTEWTERLRPNVVDRGNVSHPTYAATRRDLSSRPGLQEPGSDSSGTCHNRRRSGAHRRLAEHASQTDIFMLCFEQGVFPEAPNASRTGSVPVRPRLHCGAAGAGKLRQCDKLQPAPRQCAHNGRRVRGIRVFTGMRARDRACEQRARYRRALGRSKWP